MREPASQRGRVASTGLAKRLRDRVNLARSHQSSLSYATTRTRGIQKGLALNA